MVNDKIEEFFNKRLISNENTKKSYRVNINKYFRILNKDLDSYFSNTKPLDKYENDLKQVYTKLNKENIPLGNIRTVFNSIKQFLCTYDTRIKQLDFWDLLKTRVWGSSPISKDFIPNAEDIKTVLQHGNTLSRAMFLIQSSTGCRIGELIALYPEDIDLKTNPATITIRRSYYPKNKDKVKLMTKTKGSRICFLTGEAKDSYLAWMKERDQYLASAIKRSKYEKNPDDKRIFPMSDENARTIWKGMVVKSGLYEKDSITNRLTLHPHCLRKFFRSYLGHSDLAEHLMGHVTGMDKFYRGMKKEDLANQFLKYEKNITILEGSSNSERINGLQEQINQKDKEIQELRNDMQRLMAKVLTQDNTQNK